MTKPLDIAALDWTIKEFLPQLPRDIDLVAGVPHLGLLPASMIALYLHLPLTDVEGLLEGRVIQAGERLADLNATHPLEHARKILVVDYEVGDEDSFRAVRHRLSGLNRNAHQVLYAAVYVAPPWWHLVDFAMQPLVAGDLAEGQPSAS